MIRSDELHCRSWCEHEFGIFIYINNFVDLFLFLMLYFLCTATPTRQSGQPDRDVSPTKASVPGIWVRWPHSLGRAWEMSQRVGRKHCTQDSLAGPQRDRVLPLSQCELVCMALAPLPLFPLDLFHTLPIVCLFYCLPFSDWSRKALLLKTIYFGHKFFSDVRIHY